MDWRVIEKHGVFVVTALTKDPAIASQVKVFLSSLIAVPPPAPATIAPADILTQVSADLPFNAQPFAKGPGGAGSSIYAGFLGNSPGLHTIPEKGVHGVPTPLGTMRFGKEPDPVKPTRQALTFQLAPIDKQKHAELGQNDYGRVIVMDRVYWIAVSVYVHDWGTLQPADQALFGFQLHAGSKLDLSPTIALYTAGDGRSMQIQTRYSTDAVPSQQNTITRKWLPIPLPFGRWMDFVVRFRQSTAGQGLAQVWMDGAQIVDYIGHLGFNTPGFPAFVKWGYYNWNAFASPRKVRLRNPSLVADPGSKYTPEALRALLTKE